MASNGLPPLPPGRVPSPTRYSTRIPPLRIEDPSGNPNQIPNIAAPTMSPRLIAEMTGRQSPLIPQEQPLFPIREQYDNILHLQQPEQQQQPQQGLNVIEYEGGGRKRNTYKIKRRRSSKKRSSSKKHRSSKNRRSKKQRKV